MNKFRMAKAGINVNEALKRLCDDVDLYEEMLIKFLDDTHYSDMIKSIDEGDVKEAFLQAHSLKGIAGNLSLQKLYDAIVPVVEIFRAGELDTENQMDAVNEAYDTVVAAITDMKNKKLA